MSSGEYGILVRAWHHQDRCCLLLFFWWGGLKVVWLSVWTCWTCCRPAGSLLTCGKWEDCAFEFDTLVLLQNLNLCLSILFQVKNWCLCWILNENYGTAWSWWLSVSQLDDSSALIKFNMYWFWKKKNPLNCCVEIPCLQEIKVADFKRRAVNRGEC